MKILVAMNEFKGSLSSSELGEIVAKKISEVSPSAVVDVECIADGGDGFLSVFKNFSKRKFVTINSAESVVEAEYLVSEDGKEAVVEVATVIGLRLLKDEERNPFTATTVGLGRLLRHIILEGAEHIIVGLGGSATNDAGLGVFSELGYKFYDNNAELCRNGIGDLRKVVTLDNSGVDLANVHFTLVSDVDNPLFGTNGATYIYAKQKGLHEENFAQVDAYIKRFSEIVTKKLDIDYSREAGSGVAGGLGYGFLSFGNSKIVKGSDFVLDYLDLDRKIQEADIVITGEGKLDAQSFMGKAPIEVAKVAKKYNKKVIFLAGSVSDDEVDKLDAKLKALVDVSFSIQRSVTSLTEALDKDVASKNIEKTVEQIFRLLEFCIYEEK